jgi:hypothetical protein
MARIDDVNRTPKPGSLEYLERRRQGGTADQRHRLRLQEPAQILKPLVVHMIQKPCLCVHLGRE